MKTHILLLSLAVFCTLISCSKDDGGKLDPDAKLYINPGPGVKSDGQYLSAHEVVKQADGLEINSPYSQMVGIGDQNRDLVGNRIVYPGVWVINDYEGLNPNFLGGVDMVLINDYFSPTRDTLAYIPNTVMRKAEKEIKAAYAAGDYAACYRLFDKAFAFIPIDGPGWRELKAQGKL